MPENTTAVSEKRSSAIWVFIAALTMLTPLRNRTTSLPASLPVMKLRPLILYSVGSCDLGLEHRPFRLKGRHDRNAGLRIEQVGGRSEERQRNQQHQHRKSRNEGTAQMGA